MYKHEFKLNKAYYQECFDESEKFGSTNKPKYALLKNTRLWALSSPSRVAIEDNIETREDSTPSIFSCYTSEDTLQTLRTWLDASPDKRVLFTNYAFLPTKPSFWQKVAF